MGLPNVMSTGRSGMQAAQTGIATAGHNISNASTEGFSRQRVTYKTNLPGQGPGGNYVGRGVLVDQVERVTDEFLDKQVRHADRDKAHFEEKQLSLTQLEDVFNELGGDGLNRIVAKFFNDFRKLANEPESEAVRQSVRESAQSMARDIRKIRAQVVDIQHHMDSRIDGYVREAASLAVELRDVNLKIRFAENQTGGLANDLRDQRERLLKKLESYFQCSTRMDEGGSISVDMTGVGTIVNGPTAAKFWVERTAASPSGKPENSYDIMTDASVSGLATDSIRGGKIGALVEVRDNVLSTVLDRLDQLAYGLATSVNEVHKQGFTRDGRQGVSFFREMSDSTRAGQNLELSDEVLEDTNAIAAAWEPNAPSDNRIALAIAKIQGERIFNDGNVSMDDFYNSMVSEVGVSLNKTKNSLEQQKIVHEQLTKMREQLSGVSIDEETTNLIQYQHSFDAAAKVIQVADELIKTILDLRR